MAVFDRDLPKSHPVRRRGRGLVPLPPRNSAPAHHLFALARSPLVHLGCQPYLGPLHPFAQDYHGHAHRFTHQPCGSFHGDPPTPQTGHGRTKPPAETRSKPSHHGHASPAARVGITIPGMPGGSSTAKKNALNPSPRGPKQSLVMWTPSRLP